MAQSILCEYVGGERSERCRVSRGAEDQERSFLNETSTATVVSDTIVIMLLEHAKLATFINKPIADTRAAVWGTIALSEESREAVDSRADKAMALGATFNKDPQDYGFMYSRGFYDLDGHLIELVWMNMDAMPAE